MTVIVPLDTQPHAALEQLLDAAFGPDRRARTAYLIRTGMAQLPDLSFGLIDDQGKLIGSLQSWPVALTSAAGKQTPLIMVGPVAVAPSLQREGHGRRLMDHAVAVARTRPGDPLMLIGDPEYYARFWGFSADGTAGWRAPGPVDPRRLLALSTNGAVIGGEGMLGPRVRAEA
ncbi:MAG: N-acetyltransferase [Sphingobium sp.]